MKEFFKQLGASTLGTFIAGFFLIIIAAVVFAGVIASISGGDGEKPKVTKLEENTILHLEINGNFVERSKKYFSKQELKMIDRFGMNQLEYAIQEAKEDENVKGLFIEIGDGPSYPASANRLMKALESFKESEKIVIAYGTDWNQMAYTVSSVANESYFFPSGQLRFQGYASEVVYFKGLMEKLDMKWEVFRGKDNDYKSGIEPFTRNGMSDSSRHQSRVILDQIWDNSVELVKENRGISREMQDSIANHMLVQSSSEAKRLGLITDVKYRDEVYEVIREKLELEKDAKFPLVSFRKYASKKWKSHQWDTRKEEPNVAVIYAEGTIAYGEGDGLIIPEKIGKTIRDIKNDSTIKAVVLRVNSPGGDAIASEEIWRELDVLSNEKPLVISMGDLAASGGYYIATAGEYVYADKHTITGSIGVYGLLLDMSSFMNNKLGVQFDRVESHEYSAPYLGTRKLREKEVKRIEQSIDSIYALFLKRVADSRELTIEQVHQIARGRVWTGQDALDRKLVDELGGLDLAIQKAAELAEIEKEDVVSGAYPRKKSSPFEDIIEQIGNMEDEDLEGDQVKLNDVANSLIKELTYLSTVNGKLSFQARLPYDFKVK